MADRPFEDELDSLKADIAHLRTDVADLASAVRGATGIKTEEMRMNMQDRITATREQVRRRLYDARETGKKALNEAEESISKHPIGSVAAAVGVGFLIAKLMDMRTHR